MLCDCWVQLIRAFCGDNRRHRHIAESERLLGPSPLSDDQAGYEESQGLSLLAPSTHEVTQEKAKAAASTLIVMRHGHRRDEEDPNWHLTASRPWDPPLSKLGRKQAHEAGGCEAFKNIDLVVTSPFKRCLQTSAQVVSVLGLEQGKWLADWRLSEVCEPRVLFAGRADIKEQMKGRPVSSWMWGGLTLPEALEKFVDAEKPVDPLSSFPEVRPTAPPSYPETLEDGLLRYRGALQNIMDAYPGRTVLVVTHGECVREAVTMMQPGSEVFEVKHAAYVMMQKDPGSAWELKTEPGQTGVLWIED